MVAARGVCTLFWAWQNDASAAAWWLRLQGWATPLVCWCGWWAGFLWVAVNACCVSHMILALVLEIGFRMPAYQSPSSPWQLRPLSKRHVPVPQDNTCLLCVLSVCYRRSVASHCFSQAKDWLHHAACKANHTHYNRHAMLAYLQCVWCLYAVCAIAGMVCCSPLLLPGQGLAPPRCLQGQPHAVQQERTGP